MLWVQDPSAAGVTSNAYVCWFVNTFSSFLIGFLNMSLNGYIPFLMVFI